MRTVVRDCARLWMGALCPLLTAVLLLPAGRPAAWVGLLATVVALAWFAGRDVGIVAAASAGLGWLWAHGPDRFAGEVSDQGSIRLGFLLGAVGVVTAVALPHWRHPVR